MVRTSSLLGNTTWSWGFSIAQGANAAEEYCLISDVIVQPWSLRKLRYICLQVIVRVRGRLAVCPGVQPWGVGGQVLACLDTGRGSLLFGEELLHHLLDAQWLCRNPVCGCVNDCI
jgi:hypothetical protein